MDNQNFSFKEPMEVQNVSSEVMSKTFTARVFSWMFIGLGITGFVSYLFAATPSLIGSLLTPTGMSPLGWIVMLAPLGLVLLMGMGIQKLSYPAMVGVFVLYAALMGMSLSFIFLVYTATSLATVFFITAGMFGAMALLGYTTSTDLTKLGGILYMLLFGVIIASVVNLFLHSSSFDYMISFVCVAVFTGLTAYQVQKVKQMGGQLNADGAMTGKLSIYMALSLYLSFVNLFLTLLRLFGNRR